MTGSTKSGGAAAKAAAKPKPKAPAANAAGASATPPAPGVATAPADPTAALAAAASQAGADLAPPAEPAPGDGPSPFVGLVDFEAAIIAVGDAAAALVDIARGCSGSELAVLREALPRLRDRLAEIFEAHGLALMTIFDEAADDLVEISARSRDGKPFTRAGFAWGDSYRTVHVPADVAERLREDPNILVKADA